MKNSEIRGKRRKAQIKLRVFEEDDYFEEFEEGKYIFNNNIFNTI